jgi:hypothetical protein
MSTVLVLGGYGLFGGRLVRRLALQAGLRIVVAGRSLTAAQALVSQLQPSAIGQLQACALDASAPGLTEAIRATGAGLVVHCAGPFQGQDYRVALACLDAGAHYIDLADARDFVTGIGALNAAATSAGRAVISGASSVPALSSAVVDALTRGWRQVQHIDIGISPGNRTERGLSTVQAILSYCGKPLPTAPGDAAVVGWRGAYRHRYPAPVGGRWLSPCDVPDLSLLPLRYPGQPRVRFGAGLELAALHHGMGLMAWLRQIGWVRDWSRHAPGLLRVANLLRHLGTATGAMHVAVDGLDAAGTPCRRLWNLLATDDDGPYVPTLAAAALVRQWRRGRQLPSGARACLGLLDVADFGQAAAGLQIHMDLIE